MSASASSFLLPDAEPSWRLWRSLASTKTEPVDSPAECRESSKPIIVGLPATACRTLGLFLPSVDSQLLPSMIEAQLEKRGITMEKSGGANYAWHLLGEQQGSSLVSVDVLATPFPQDLALPHAANYTAALRTMHLPPGEITLVEEQGWIVLAVGWQGKLWYSCILGATDMDAPSLAREISIAKLSLENQDSLGVLRGVVLVGPRLSAIQQELKSQLDLPVEVIPSLEPNRALKTETFSRLLPSSVFQAQSAKKLRQRILRISLLLIAIYAVIAALAWWYLKSLQQQESTLRTDVELTRGPVSELQATAQRWRALEPAMDIQRYPMVQLSEITSLMPPSGVLIRKFSTKLTEIEISGDSRDAQTATQFLEDLKKHPKLSRFSWTMPVPSVRDKVATFKIQGKLEGS